MNFLDEMIKAGLVSEKYQRDELMPPKIDDTFSQNIPDIPEIQAHFDELEKQEKEKEQKELDALLGIPAEDDKPKDDVGVEKEPQKMEKPEPQKPEPKAPEQKPEPEVKDEPEEKQDEPKEEKPEDKKDDKLDQVDKADQKKESADSMMDQIYAAMFESAKTTKKIMEMEMALLQKDLAEGDDKMQALEACKSRMESIEGILEYARPKE